MLVSFSDKEKATRLATATVNGGLALLLTLIPAALAQAHEAALAAPINAADTAWILSATALVLLMTPGLAFFYGGMVSRDQIVPCMFQSFIAMGIVSLLWVALGFSLAFGDSQHGLIGNPATFLFFRHVGAATHPLLSPTIPLALFALFQMKFAIITPALVSGAFAERIRFGAFVLFITLFTLLVYAPVAHWTWHPLGLLRSWGVLDFAGGTVVHMTAGFAGLAGALTVRRSKAAGERSLGTHAPMSPASVPLVLLGAGLLWFGWFGFNAGSALAANESAVQAFLTTNMAAAAAMIAWLLRDYQQKRKPDAFNAAVAAVVGLVAITPAAGYVSVGASVAIGIIAALVSHELVNFHALKVKLQDTLDVFACHGAGGVTGMLLTAVFAVPGGLLTGSATLLGKHVMAIFLVAGYSFSVSASLYWLIGRFKPLTDAQSVPDGVDACVLDGGVIAVAQIP